MENQNLKQKLMSFYDKRYKKFMIFTFVVLLLAFAQIGYQIYTTGDFMSKGVSLKGGVTVTISKVTDSTGVENYLQQNFPKSDVSVKTILTSGATTGMIVEASDIDEKMLVDTLKQKLDLKENEYNVESMGSSLGDSFFKETLRIILLSFLLMAIVVFLYFGENLMSKIVALTLTAITMPMVYLSVNVFMWTISIILIATLFYIYFKYSIPSFAVILCAFSDMITTLAVINMLGVKIESAGIAAFLMMLGYSIDTDIVLSTNVIKRKATSITESIFNAMGTGFVMSATTIVAALIAFFFAESELLKQIMLIVSIGLFIDLPFTWVQNGGILKWHFEIKEKKHKHEQA